MIFNGINGQRVELKILGYESPEKINDYWDDNWLNIYLNVKSQIGDWEVTDPSLTTWEVQEIIDWFKTLAGDEVPEYRQLNFTEPNLSFELLENNNKITHSFLIKFNLESRPGFAADDKECYINCAANKQELIQIADALKAELDKYPER